MFFKNNAKKYLTPEVENEIKQKWFGVYNYISLRELLLTVRKDYLFILNKINIFFGIISIIVWIGAFFSWNFFLFFYFLFLVYFFIFSYLVYKLIKRTHYFLKISDIIYTDNWIILWDKIFKYSDKKNLEEKLICYEEQFSEFLWQSSKLEEIIAEKKKQLVFMWKNNSNKNILEKILYYSEKIFRNSDKDALARLALPALLSFVAYAFFMYIFYYIWYFLSFVFFYIYSFFLKIILYFKNSTELEIKNKTIKIDDSFSKMNKIYEKLKEKLDSFKAWDIENIEKFVWKNFEKFYEEINVIMDNKKQLLEIIKNSKYKDFIDFEKLKKYLKNSFNKPLLDMISMLKKYENLTKKSLENKSFSEKNLKSEYDAIIAKRKIILEKNLENLRRNIVVLEGTVM